MSASITDEGKPASRATLQAIGTLAVDLVTAEVVMAFEERGIPSILLKGPSIARWLYPRGGRGYGDTDLLVPGRYFDQAAGVLVERGFVAVLDGFAPLERDPDEVEQTFERRRRNGRGPDGVVDLHRNLHGLATPDDLLWACFSADVDRITVGGVDVAVLSRTGVALHIVVHAVGHRFGLHTGEDLRRALATLSPDDWRAVAELAATIGAGDLLGYGLRHAVGADAAEQLGLPALSSGAGVDGRPIARGGPALVRCWSDRTPGGMARRLRWVLLPSRAKICLVSDIKRPTRGAVALGYVRWWWSLPAALLPATRWAIGERRRTAGLRAEPDASNP